MHNLKERIRETTAFQLHFKDTSTFKYLSNLFVQMQIYLFKCIKGQLNDIFLAYVNYFSYGQLNAIFSAQRKNKQTNFIIIQYKHTVINSKQ